MASSSESSGSSRLPADQPSEHDSNESDSSSAASELEHRIRLPLHAAAARVFVLNCTHAPPSHTLHVTQAREALVSGMPFASSMEVVAGSRHSGIKRRRSSCVPAGPLSNWLVKLNEVCVRNNLPRESRNALLQVNQEFLTPILRSALGQYIKLPKSGRMLRTFARYEQKTTGTVQRIHICEDECIAFNGPNSQLTTCSVCNKSRYELRASSTASRGVN